MLTGFHTVFIGGDARQLEVIKKCSELDATITLIGFNRLQNEYSGATKADMDSEALKSADALILPIVGTNADGVVESIFSEKTIVLKEKHIQHLPKHCVIYTGMANDYLLGLTSPSNIKVVQLLERNDVAIYNSIPTVEGAIMMAIQNTDITIHDADVIVLGLGRTGMSVARAFAALGARVSVGAREKEHLARIYEMGLIPFHINELSKHVHHCDILLNTIPAPIVKAEILSRMPPHTFILDLASHPGGTDFRFAQKRGIKAILAPSLPGIVAPKTAGKIIAGVVTELLSDQHLSGRE